MGKSNGNDSGSSAGRRIFAGLLDRQRATGPASKPKRISSWSDIPEGPGEDPQDGAAREAARVPEPRGHRKAKEIPGPKPKSRRAARAVGDSGDEISPLFDIGHRFAELRAQGGRSEAWSQFQLQMMSNLGPLVLSGAASLDVCVSLGLKIEEYIAHAAASGKSAPDLFADWLRGNDAA